MNDASGRVPRVSAIVVSRQVCGRLRRCLSTLLVQRGVEPEIWVVDNASTDGSPEMVAREFPSVHLIRNPENVGFARANNLALARATADYLALLNPDTELPAEALAAAVGVFSRHPRAGVVGLALDNADGSPQPSCHAFPGVLNLTLEATGLHRPLLRLGWGTPTAAPIPPGGEGVVDWVSGACFILSRAAYERVGGLDERLFLYGEEPDYCWRARAAGFTTVHSEVARVLHHGGASGAGLRGPLFVRNLEARLLFLRTHRGAWRAALAREIMTAGSVLRLVFWWLRSRLEGRAEVRAQSRGQVERFAAVLQWRFGRHA